MNTSTGATYYGEVDISAAIARGEPVVEVSQRVAQAVETGLAVMNRHERRGRHGKPEETREGVDTMTANPSPFIDIKFQDGPIKEHGINGCQVDEVLQLCVEKLQEFNRRLPCRETSLAITKVEEALYWLDHRTRRRLAEGVEGTESPHRTDRG